MPQKKTKWESYKHWAMTVLPILRKRIMLLEESVYNDDVGSIKQKARLTRLEQKVKLMAKEVEEGWLMSEDNRGVEFKPLWLNKSLVERYFLNHAEQFLIMSATIPSKPIFCGLLGIDPEDVDYLEIPSTFPLINRLVHYQPVVDLSRDRMKQELPKLTTKIKEIINAHPNERVLIHSVSYKLARAIYDGINSSRVLIHDSTNKDAMVSQYLHQDNAVIISPSLERGVSFEDEKCRVIIWAKIPWQNLGDKFINKRLFSSRFGKLWYQYQAIHTIVQGVGRAVRHKDDFSKTYILDSQFERLIKNAILAPNWFREAVVWE